MYARVGDACRGMKVACVARRRDVLELARVAEGLNVGPGRDTRMTRRVVCLKASPLGKRGNAVREREREQDSTFTTPGFTER